MWKKTPAKQTEAAFLMIRRRNDFCDKIKNHEVLYHCFLSKQLFIYCHICFKIIQSHNPSNNRKNHEET